MVRIVHVNASDSHGGAAKAAYRLHSSLNASGIDSSMLVQDKEGRDLDVYGARTKIGKLSAKIRPYLDRVPLTIFRYPPGFNFSTAIVPSNLIKRLNLIKADVVHLHWINHGFLRLESLTSLRNTPIVWTLHDSWPFTGGCHVPYPCTRYKERCGKCPVLNSSKEYDLSRWIWNRKHRTLKPLQLSVVTPSKWLSSCAEHSNLFKGKRIEVIPNGINTNSFKPLNTTFCRDALSLPHDKIIILFGAMYSTSDTNKGFTYLLSALRIIAKTEFQDKFITVVLGTTNPENRPDIGLDVKYLGHLHDDTSLAIAYSAADIFVAPSKQENLSNMVMEAMACGTPCAAFDIGGMPDMISHKQTGYLAQPYNVEDLAEGMLWITRDTTRNKALSKQSRLSIVKNFSELSIAKRYANLYKQILGRW